MSITQPPPPFDLAQIRYQWGSATDETYRIILEIFAGEAETLCAEASASIAEDRRADLARAAHTLAGAAANVGALHLAHCAGALEESAESGARHILETQCQTIRAAWDRVQAEITMGGPQGDG